MLLGGAAVWLAYRCRRPMMLAGFALAAAPSVLLHHVFNYAIGGTLGPANGVPAYFDWPGCPFNVHTMTGVWSHPGVGSLVLYALDLLIGKQGFLTHNLPLLLAIPVSWRLCRRPSADRPELLLSAGWCIAVWLLYSVTSTNHSGVCCSVRWFVPLLAPAYYVLAVWLPRLPAHLSPRLLRPLRLGHSVRGGDVVRWAVDATSGSRLLGFPYRGVGELGDERYLRAGATSPTAQALKASAERRAA